MDVLDYTEMGTLMDILERIPDVPDVLEIAWEIILFILVTTYLITRAYEIYSKRSRKGKTT